MAEERNIDDLDEDLFNFGTVAEIEEDFDEDEEDLESIFAAFQAEEDQAAEARAAAEAAAAALEEESEPEPEPAATSTHMFAPGFEVPEDEPPPPPKASGFQQAPLNAPVAPVARRRAPEPVESGAPVVAAPVTATAVSNTFSKSVLLILFSVTMLNGLVAFVTLRNGASMRDSVIDARRELSETAEEIREDSIEAAVDLVEARTPLVPPNPDDHPTFEWAASAIERGEFAEARQRIYALLSVVDRLEESERTIVESRAQYLLAQASHLEAVARLGGKP